MHDTSARLVERVLPAASYRQWVLTVRRRQGVTESEALKNIEDSIRECLEVRAEKGMPLTVAVHQVDISI